MREKQGRSPLGSLGGFLKKLSEAAERPLGSLSSHERRTLGFVFRMARSHHRPIKVLVMTRVRQNGESSSKNDMSVISLDTQRAANRFPAYLRLRVCYLIP